MVRLDQDDAWHLPDELWRPMELLLPGVHPTRWSVITRAFRNARPWTPIFVVHPGTQWQMPRATGICSPSLTCHRFCELTDVRVFEGL